MKRTNKYPNGYLPKIEYWTEVLKQAIANNEGSYPIERAMEKLRYFSEKHIDSYCCGTITD